MSEPIYNSDFGWSIDGINWHKEKSMAELNELELAKINEQTDRYQEGVQAERQRVLGLIGEDERITRWSGDSRFDQQVSAEVAGANVLRQQLRKAIRENLQP